MYSSARQMFTTATSDFRLIFRDRSLRIFLLLPFLVVIVIKGVLPHLAGKYEQVIEYVPYVLMAATLQTSTMFGFIYSMVLIDEKDTGVNKVYGILPVSKKGLVIYRLLFPFVFASTVTFIILVLQPFYNFTPLFNVLISLLTGFLGPIFALIVTNFSSNKMQGMTWYKGVNALINLPLLVFFIPEKFSLLFGWIPSHWIFQSIDQYILGQPHLPSLVGGYVLCLGILVALIAQFSKKHFV